MGWFVWTRIPSPVDRPLPSPPGSAPAISTPGARTFEYWLTVQPWNVGPQGDPVDSAGDEVFNSGSRFRFNFTNPQPGFVYVLNEGKGPAGNPQLTMLYPTPRSGSAEVPAGGVARTGHYFFAGQGVEHVWIAWSAQQHQLLENARRWVTPEDRGLIKDGAENAIVLGLLMNGAKGTKARPDWASKRTIVSGSGDLLVYRADLRIR